MRILAAAATALLLALPALAETPQAAPALPSTTPGAVDPFAYLEDIHGARAMAWVEKQNRRTAAVLETDPRFEPFRKEALAIFTAKDRIPIPGFLGDQIDNLWQDETHPHGLWRVTTAKDYRADNPHWRTLINLDALSKTEGRSLFFKGASCLAPEDRLCLVRLSEGGGDAVEIREFDAKVGAFIDGGFHFAKSKQDAAWLDRDTLLLASDFGPGTLTQSGYPFIVKLIKRGETTDRAAVAFRGAPTDVRVFPRVFRKSDGAVAEVLIGHNVGFFSTIYMRLLPDGATAPLDLPPKNKVFGYLAGRLIVEADEAWPATNQHGAFAAGALVAVDPKTGGADLIFQPNSREALVAVAVTKDRLLVHRLENVLGVIDAYQPEATGWRHKTLALPGGASLDVTAADRGSDQAFVTSESFLDPTALWAVDAATGAVAKVKSLPARFDASKDVTEQHFATSADGTRIPYFLVRPKAMKRDGSTPVQMFGYGGFQLSETPAYKPELGKLWLERGGAYVVANLRGGGEFGPAWHEAAMGEHRQRAFDDFAAVAEDLIATKVTSPRRLGIYARSNGGILTSVSITQHPELFNAAVIESPLIDMLRYNHLSAGASWMAEYGNPDVPADRAVIAKYSAYTQLKPGVKYPEPYITTNTEDDRVHPGHARKFAAELEALGDPYLFYENTFGGHAMDADPDLSARRWARHYVYLSEKLMD
jgi:prolyl oligopeptidase